MGMMYFDPLLSCGLGWCDLLKHILLLVLCNLVMGGRSVRSGPVIFSMVWSRLGRVHGVCITQSFIYYIR